MEITSAPRQNTPDPGSKSSLNTAVPLGSVSMNLNYTLCLPVLADNNKFLWVYSDQIDPPLEVTAELDKAFDRFPYLSHEQTAALAQSCSLHPDQVKVWFMAQRLRYGISWDYEDICEIWNNFRSTHGEAELNQEVHDWRDGETKDDRRQGKNSKEKEEASGETEGRVTGRKVRANWERKVKNKRKKVKDEAGSLKKQKGGAVMEKRRVELHGDDNERADEVEQQIKSEGAAKTFSNHLLKPSTQDFKAVLETGNETVQLDRTEVLHAASDTTPMNISSKDRTQESGLKEDLQAGAMDLNSIVTDMSEIKKLLAIDNIPVIPDGSLSGIQQEVSQQALPPRSHRKTEAQLRMLKRAFLHCQYPDGEQYTWLAELIGIPRSTLVQWYGDMRYALKRCRPRWMNMDQYTQVLQNILYQQYKTVLSKIEPKVDDTWKILQDFKTQEEKDIQNLPPD